MCTWNVSKLFVIPELRTDGGCNNDQIKRETKLTKWWWEEDRATQGDREDNQRTKWGDGRWTVQLTLKLPKRVMQQTVSNRLMNWNFVLELYI